MNDFIQSIFITHPPAPARGQPDPLLPIRRSFGEGDTVVALPLARTRSRTKFPARPKRTVGRS
jgi:hypothetical protein